MVEGDNPSPPEIGRGEKRFFVKRVTDLIESAQRPERQGNSISAHYEKGQDFVSLSIPKSKHRPRLGDKVSASVSNYSLRQPEEHLIEKTKEITFFTSKTPNDVCVYKEKTEVFDRGGERVWPPKTKADSEAKTLFKMLNREREKFKRGETTVTRARYNDIMVTLNSLTPEDEVP